VPQFLIVAYDGTDEGAAERRRQTRPAHFEALQRLVAEGRIKAGGALLDDNGAMVGSSVIADFPDRAALDAWLKVEPYVVGGVWKQIEVTPFRLAVLDGKVTP
jgi:uncharacterized protein YciI